MRGSITHVHPINLGMAQAPKTQFARHLRKSQTEAERLLWQALRGRRCGGYKFRRQVPKDKYIVDFICESQKFIVEVDGPSHQEAEDYDAARTQVLERLGYTVIRLANEDCFDDMDASVEAIWQALENATP